MEKINKDKPGLSSVSEYNRTAPDVTSVGSRKRVARGSGNPTTPTTPVTPPPKTTAPTKPPTGKPVVKATPSTLVRGASNNNAPSSHTSSSFKIGNKNYYVVDDNSDVRGMIKWDDKGNVDPTSPVQVIGKNASGGFVLAADEATQGVTKSKFPYSEDKGINFYSLESDEGLDTPYMQSIHRKEFPDLSEVVNPGAASELRGIYRRTGQL